MCAALLPLLLAREGALSLSPEVTSGLLLLVATMPLWWLLGSLPPVDAAVGWAAEQLAIHLHGGSAAASPARLIYSLVGSWVTVGVTVGATVGATVGVTVGAAVGVTVGVTVGATVGATVGPSDGITEGIGVGISLGRLVGKTDGI